MAREISQGEKYVNSPAFDVRLELGVLIVDPSVADGDTVSIITAGGDVETLPVWVIRVTYPKVVQINSGGTTVGAASLWVVS